MHIGICGPVATSDIKKFVDGNIKDLPTGYKGAPLLSSLIGELSRRGHKVSVFTTTPIEELNGKKLLIKKSNLIDIYYCGKRAHSFRPENGKLGRAVDFFYFERKLLTRAINIAVPEIVHAHWIYEFGLASLKTDVPCLVTCHDSPLKVLTYIPNLYRLVRLFMGIMCLKKASYISTVSPYLKEEVLPYCKSKIVTVIPNPLPEGNGKKNISNNKMNKDPKISMVINGWGKIKNAENGIKAFNLFRKKNAKAKLFLYGHDFEKNGIAEKWVLSKNLQAGVHFIGPLPYDKLMKEISDSDLLLHTALEESFGMVVAEAMSLGIPVVGGSKSGAVPWVIGKGGVLTNVSSPELICVAVEKILNNKEQYIQFSKKAKESSIKRFSLEEVVDKYEREYQKVLNK